MEFHELPVGAHPAALPAPHFPTLQQAIVWRNWEMVPVERLAAVLRTGAEHVLELARGLGLPTPPQVNERWMSHGYITLIRQNWHLLTYEQLLQLLDWSAEKLDYALREDDFLWIKLGNLKPRVQPARYAPLTPEQQAQTAQLRALMERHFPPRAEPSRERPFDFLTQLQTPARVERRVFGAVRPGEVTLDASWRVRFPATGHIPAFVARFQAEHAARWGIELNDAGGAVLDLRIAPQNDWPRESHRIEIAPDGIRLTAADESGVLRGLQWLEAAMERRGGPFLKTGVTERRTRFDLRLIYPYCGVYGDPLLEADADPLPPGLLSRLSRTGVNGVWLQVPLYALTPWHIAPELSAGHEQRLEKLRRLIARAAGFGIGVYLYCNEPRALPLRYFENNPALRAWQGARQANLGVATLCTSQPGVLDLLRESVAQLFQAAPELAGLFTITMSENPTHCRSRHVPAEDECPRCRDRSVAAMVAEVNRAIAEGAHSAQPSARILAWDWAWKDDWAQDVVQLLPDDVELMCTSETAMPTNVGGVPGAVIDYSISQVGPGERARSLWASARQRSLPANAKVQFNNSWECSAVPYLPVLELLREHLQGLRASGVSGLLLSWTLGGSPSPNLALASNLFWDDNDSEENLSSLDDWAAALYGDAGPPVRRAWSCFSRAFQQFPFAIGTLYVAPQNTGPGNLLYAQPTGYRATMVGFPYDDLERWKSIYPAEVFEEQFRLLSEGWQDGLELVAEARAQSIGDNQAALRELHNVAQTAYAHFRSTYLQIRFVRLREQQPLPAAEIARVLDEEIALAKQMHALIGEDSRLGYEASNHYYYTANSLREKVLNCEYLRRNLVAPNAE